MKNFKRITAFILIFCLLISMTQILASATNTEVTVQLKGTQDYTEAYKVLEIVNQNRAKEGLPALTMDEDLMATAMQRAAECSIYFSHTRPDGTTCFTAFPSKFEYGSRAENIAIGQNSASAVMNSWMNSSGHKANIMNSKFTTIGIGCFYQDGAISWVQLFASAKGTSPSVRPVNKQATSTVDVLTDNLDIYFNIVKSTSPSGEKFKLYNMNIEYPNQTTFIELEDTNITYGSANKSILDVTSS